MLKLFDTMSRSKRAFRPPSRKPVLIYTCGPSVYNFAHIGNFRTYLFEDILVRYLLYKGYLVKRVMNITDVEDKAIATARKERESLSGLQDEKIRAFLRGFRKLGMLKPDVLAKASEHIQDMIRLIERLCERGYCIDDKDGIYFDVRRFKGYGRLRGLAGKTYLGRARKDDYAKEGLWDFRLWKRWSRGDGKVFWDSPFGKGRPGWHIECSAMAMRHLGESIDIHCGGSDNVFPHHENEIAQSEGATGKRFADFWLHARHLTIGKRKMSKSTGNVMYLEDLEERGARPRCIRHFLISKSYRRRLDFTMEGLRRDAGRCDGVRDILRRMRIVRSAGGGERGRRLAASLIASFERAMDDDLDTGRAIRSVYGMMKKAGIEMRAGRLKKEDCSHILHAMDKISSVLGVF